MRKSQALSVLAAVAALAATVSAGPASAAEPTGEVVAASNGPVRLEMPGARWSRTPPR
jgi:hypothetical protein